MPTYRLYIRSVIDVKADHVDDTGALVGEKYGEAIRKSGLGTLRSVEITAATKMLPDTILTTQEHEKGWWNQCTNTQIKVALMCLPPGRSFCSVVDEMKKERSWVDPNILAAEVTRMIKKGILKERTQQPQ